MRCLLLRLASVIDIEDVMICQLPQIIVLNHSLALQKSYFLNPPHKPSGNVMLFYNPQLYINVTDVPS